MRSGSTRPRSTPASSAPRDRSQSSAESRSLAAARRRTAHTARFVSSTRGGETEGSLGPGARLLPHAFSTASSLHNGSISPTSAFSVSPCGGCPLPLPGGVGFGAGALVGLGGRFGIDRQDSHDSGNYIETQPLSRPIVQPVSPAAASDAQQMTKKPYIANANVAFDAQSTARPSLMSPTREPHGQSPLVSTIAATVAAPSKLEPPRRLYSLKGANFRTRSISDAIRISNVRPIDTHPHRPGGEKRCQRWPTLEYAQRSLGESTRSGDQSGGTGPACSPLSSACCVNAFLPHVGAAGADGGSPTASLSTTISTGLPSTTRSTFSRIACGTSCGPSAAAPVNEALGSLSSLLCANIDWFVFLLEAFLFPRDYYY